MTKVSMYIISTCPVCRKTKEFFRARGIAYNFVDFNLASEKEQDRLAPEIMKGTGDTGFTLIRADDVMVTGFNSMRFEQLLNSKKLEPIISGLTR